MPPLRDWLTRKQRETRRGRAELRLAERAALWNGRPMDRFLPPWWEWLALRLHTRPHDWTAPERTMMRRAARHHLTRGVLLSAAAILLVLAGREGYGRQRAQGLQDRLLEASTEDVPAIVRGMGPYRRWLDGPLRNAYAEAAAKHQTRRQLHASLGLLPVDPAQVGYLSDGLLTVGPDEVVVIRDALLPHAALVGPRLWRVSRTRTRCPASACGQPAHWRPTRRTTRGGRESSADVAARLVAENGLILARWAEALRPVRRHLLGPLAALLVEDGRDAASRRMITGLYGDYALGLPDALAPLENEAAPAHESAADFDSLLTRPRRQAIAAAALASLGQWAITIRLLAQSPDPTVRSYLIDHLGPGGAEPGPLEALLRPDADVSVRRAALLALGEFDEDRLPLPERARLATRVADLYRDDIDPGIHGAAGWLLRQWGQEERVAAVDRALSAGKPVGLRRWYINSLGQTMVVIPPGDVRRGPGTGRIQDRVDHRIAVAAREVTGAEFRRFRPNYAMGAQFAESDDCPANDVSWYDAVAYCNWLSEQDGIPKEQWCYAPNEQGHNGEGMKIHPDFLSRSGYRLPTVLEWEYACRAGTATRWYMGKCEDLLTKYAWGVTNAASRLHPVATLRPNDLGLFDMLGNAWEWCHDRDETKAAGGSVADKNVVTSSHRRLARGGAFGHGPLTMSSIGGTEILPKDRGGDLGFRPVRTVP